MGTIYEFVHYVYLVLLYKHNHLYVNMCVFVLECISGAKRKVTLTLGGVWQCIDTFFTSATMSISLRRHNHYGHNTERVQENILMCFQLRIKYENEYNCLY